VYFDQSDWIHVKIKCIANLPVLLNFL